MQFALPDLAGFVAAGVLLLIACGLILLAALLAGTLGKAPVIGGWVSRDLAGWLRDAGNAVLSASKATWHFATGLFNWAQDILTKPLIYLFKWALSAYQWLHVLFTQTIPDAENRALNYAAGLVDTAEADASHLFAVAERDTASLVDTAELRAAALFHDAETYAARLTSDAEKSLAAAIQAAEAAALSAVAAAERTLTGSIAAAVTGADNDLRSLSGQVNTVAGELARDIVTEVQGAEATAAAALAAVQSGIYTDLEQWGDQAVTHVWPDAAGDIGALKGVLGNDFPWLQDLLGALGGLGTAGLAGALIRAIAGTEAITRLATDCVVPNCRNLSQFGTDLQDLIGVAALAALVAWLAAGVADPASWAQDMQTVAYPLGARWAAAANGMFGAP